MPPIVEQQRFFPCYQQELVDWESIPVKRYIGSITDPRALANKVIIDVQYPMHLGIPDDLHIWNAFHGKACYRVPLDFWQKGSETAYTRRGDCEDSSILYVSGARNFLGEEAVYEIFGEVYQAGQLLGGHGWGVSWFDDERFRLVESTLDEPPDEYPIVPDIFQPFQLNDLVYKPKEIWNDKRHNLIGTYTGKRDTWAKYLAIEAAWRITPKPLRELRKRRNKAKRVIFLTYRRV